MYNQATDGLNQVIDSKTNQVLEFADFYFEKKEEEALFIAKNYSQNEELINDFKSKNREVLDKKIKAIFQ